MMHNPAFHRFVPTGEPVEQTVFHRDGTRTVCGPLGTILYDVDGNAHFVTEAHADPAATVRYDLAA